MFRSARRLAVLTALAAVPAFSMGTEPDGAVAAYSEGARIVEENDPERAAATTDGMLRGALMIEKAIALGFRDKPSAHRMLGYAYSQVGFGTRDPTKRLEYLQRSKSAYEVVLKLDGSDVDAAKALIGVQPSDELKLEAIRRVVAMAPDNYYALFMLGRTLVSGGANDIHRGREERDPEIEEGVIYLKRAAAAANGVDAAERRREVAGTLERSGRKADAEEVRRAYRLGRPDSEVTGDGKSGQ